MRNRRGFSIIEVVAAGTVLAVLLTVVMQLLGTTIEQRRATLDRRMAAREAANLMEQIFARSWDDLAVQKAPAVLLSDDLKRSLSESSLNIEITAPDDPAKNEPHGKRILVEISWQHRPDQHRPDQHRPDQHRPDQPRRSVRLVALRYHLAKKHESDTAAEKADNNGDSPQ